jgi:DNA-directed RNA polymerase specialized sigma24 family protein
VEADVTFEEFVAARLGVLVRYATVVTWDPHLTEDIIQNVLVKAQGRRSRIGRLDAPESYVKRMVVNEFLSWRRRRAARLVSLPGESLEAFTSPVPDLTAHHDDRDAMLRLIATLVATGSSHDI